MHYQSDGTQTNTRPAPAPVSGVPGWVTNGDPANAIPASDDDQDVVNAILDELCTIVTGLGGTLDKNNSKQILPLLRGMAGGSFQAVGATQNVAVPANCTSAQVWIWAGGGGGGGSAGAGSIGSGGGGGCFVLGTVIGLVPGSSIAVTVGTGGSGGQNGANGTPGSISGFGNYFSVAPGGYGIGAAANVIAQPGGSSGVNVAIGPNAGCWQRNGAGGGTGFDAGGSGIVAGPGGDAFGCGPVLSTSNNTAAQSGIAGNNPGQGGGGGLAGGGGGNGANGLVLIFWRA